MRHGKKVNHLGRQAPHRKALLSNLASSLLLHKRINTTLAKAKALRPYVEPLINRSKDDTTHSRRIVFSYLQNKEAVTELFREIAPKVAERPGGYTRIIKLGHRKGDNAEICVMELVDFNELLVGGKEKKAGKTTRRGRRGPGKAKAVETSAAETTEAASTEETSSEATEKEAAPKKRGRKKKED